jgi:hypothetical protein
MEGNREHHIKWSKTGSKRQRSQVFFHMWKLDIHTHTHTHTHTVREIKIVLVDLSERGKEIVREWMILKHPNYVWTQYNVMPHKLLDNTEDGWKRKSK